MFLSLLLDLWRRWLGVCFLAMDAIDIMGINFTTKLRAREEAVCLEDHTDMGPVVHEKSAQHAWACIAFCLVGLRIAWMHLFVSEFHGSA